MNKALDKNGAPGNWDRIVQQFGMFSYIGIASQKVMFMREKHHIYFTLDGRISVARLTEWTVTYAADAMMDALLSAVIQL